MTPRKKATVPRATKKAPEQPPPNGQEMQMQIHLLELANLPIQAGQHPLNAASKAILIGPVMLAIPLGDEASRKVVQGLTGIIIPTTGDPSALAPGQ